MTTEIRYTLNLTKIELDELDDSLQNTISDPDYFPFSKHTELRALIHKVGLLVHSKEYKKDTY